MKDSSLMSRYFPMPLLVTFLAENLARSRGNSGERWLIKYTIACIQEIYWAHTCIVSLPLIRVGATVALFLTHSFLFSAYPTVLVKLNSFEKVS